MKKIIAAAGALALTAGLAFGETHETLKAHTLQTGVGDISFGAWGRSTFNVGRQMTKTKIDVDVVSAMAQAAASDLSAATAKYEAIKNDATLWGTIEAAAGKDEYGNNKLRNVSVGDTYTKKTKVENGSETYIDTVSQVWTQDDYTTNASTAYALYKGTLATAAQTAQAYGNAGNAYLTASQAYQADPTNAEKKAAFDTAKAAFEAVEDAYKKLQGSAKVYADALVKANGGTPAGTDTLSTADAATIGALATEAGTVGTTLVADMAKYGYTDAEKYLNDCGTAMALVNMLKKYEKDESNSKGFASLEPDWSYGSRVGFWIIGRTPDQKYGFDFNLDADAHALFVHKLWDADEASDNVNYNEDGKYAVAIGDQAKVWGLFDTPFGLQNKVAFGKMREQELRGTIGDFGQRESGDVKSEDDIFSEFWPTTGLFVSTKGQEDSALEGFYAAAAIDLSAPMGIATKDRNSGAITSRTESAVDKNSGKSIGFYDAMRTMQAGIGYTVPGLVQVKAQYWGDSISEWNYRYARNTYKAARKAGFDMNDYYGRMEFGIDWLGFMGGASSFLDPNLNLSETPNANLIELGFKLPIVTDNDLRDYDPEKFYNWYSCLGTMGVIKQGFIMYKGHVWGGQGVSNLAQYTDITGSGEGLLQMKKGDGANIFMAGVDFLAEVCINPFGKQDVFVGVSGNYNITSAKADGKAISMDNELTLNDLKLRQHNIGAEIYIKKTFAANNFMFAGIADRFSLQTMDGNVNNIVDLSYKSQNHRIYMPIGVEMFF